MKNERPTIGEIREFAFGGLEYEQACDLRDRVLRQPLGLSLFGEDLSLEREQRHFGVFQAERLLACAVVVPGTVEQVKIRQVAVEPAAQRQGLGGRLLERLACQLYGEGCLEIVLHARLDVVRFYENLGYDSEGDEFQEIGLPHLKMKKALEEEI